MSENLQKLVGVVVMAVLVVVGVVVSSGDDTDFSRNRSFSSAAETFAGADRLEDPDCCDQNAYEILKLETQLAEMNNKVASLDAELDELQQLQPSIAAFLNSFSSSGSSEILEEAAEEVWKACPRPAWWPYPPKNLTTWEFRFRATCFYSALVGLEINLAKAIVELDEPGLKGEWAAPNFTAFHRSSRADYSTDVELTSEACLPIFSGSNAILLALDTVAGIVVHPTLSPFYAKVIVPTVLNPETNLPTYLAWEWSEKAEELC